MTKPDEVDRIVHGLIREHLARTNRKDVLAQFDLDVPRKEDSLTKTKQIVSAFGSAGKKLYKQNKESKKPLLTMLDVISHHYYKVTGGNKKSKSSKVKKTATKKTSSVSDISVGKIQVKSKTVKDNSNTDMTSQADTAAPVDTFYGFEVVEDSASGPDISPSAIENIPVQSEGFFQKPLAFQKKSKAPPLPTNAVSSSTSSSIMMMEDIGEDELYDFS